MGKNRRSQKSQNETDEVMYSFRIIHDDTAVASRVYLAPSPNVALLKAQRDWKAFGSFCIQCLETEEVFKSASVDFQENSRQSRKEREKGIREARKFRRDQNQSFTTDNCLP